MFLCLCDVACVPLPTPTLWAPGVPQSLHASYPNLNQQILPTFSPFPLPQTSTAPTLNHHTLSFWPPRSCGPPVPTPQCVLEELSCREAELGKLRERAHRLWEGQAAGKGFVHRVSQLSAQYLALSNLTKVILDPHLPPVTPSVTPLCYPWLGYVWQWLEVFPASCMLCSKSSLLLGCVHCMSKHSGYSAVFCLLLFSCMLLCHVFANDWTQHGNTWIKCESATFSKKKSLLQYMCQHIPSTTYESLQSMMMSP